MPPPPAARDKVLDAFERLLTDHGPRAATLDAVAAEAGVSKGGLLYHFPSREALTDGLLARLRERGTDDVEAMRNAPEGPLHYYLDGSKCTATPGSLSATYVAVMQLAEQADGRARAALVELADDWLDVLSDATGDRAVAQVLALLGDGIWLNATIGAGKRLDVGEILHVVERLTSRSG